MRRFMKKTIIALLVLSLGILAVLMAYRICGAAGDRDLSGEWTAQLDMSGQAAAMAYGWLRDIEAVSVSLEEVEACMRNLNIQVEMTMDETDRSGGTFRCSVLPESYDACYQAAYEAFAVSFRVLVAERLRMAGHGEGTDEEAVEALITETFGMSAVAYLMSCGPALLPSLEELQARYDGSGTYEAGDGILTRRFDTEGAAGTVTEQYIREGSGLILLGETEDAAAGGFAEHYPLVFMMKQPEEPENNIK